MAPLIVFFDIKGSERQNMAKFKASSMNNLSQKKETHTHTQTLYPLIFRSLLHTHTHTQKHYPLISRSLTHTHTHTNNISLDLSLSHTYTHTHTDTHTHTLTHKL